MSLTPEEMFYLATGLVDVNSWNGQQDQDPCSRTRRGSGRSRRPTYCRLEQPTYRRQFCTNSRQGSVNRPDEEEEQKRNTGSSSLKESSSSSSSLSSRAYSSWNRTSWPTLTLTVALLLFSLCLRVSEGCSSRSTPKPRPPPPPPSPTPAVRPNITFQTYACPPAYAAWYCLNGATCFTVKIGESILYNCECTDGYMGQRCEFKDLDGSYLPLREKIMLERASIAGGATVAVVLVVILSIIFYTYVRQRRKEKRISNVVEVTVEKLERRSRSLSWNSNSSSNNNSFRCGSGTGKCSGIQCVSSAVSDQSSSQAKPVQVDARLAYCATNLAVDLTPINAHPSTTKATASCTSNQERNCMEVSVIPNQKQIST